MMEGYFNVSGSLNAFDDFDIEGKKSFDDIQNQHNDFDKSKVKVKNRLRVLFVVLRTVTLKICRTF